MGVTKQISSLLNQNSNNGYKVMSGKNGTNLTAQAYPSSTEGYYGGNVSTTKVNTKTNTSKGVGSAGSSYSSGSSGSSGYSDDYDYSGSSSSGASGTDDALGWAQLELQRQNADRDYALSQEQLQMQKDAAALEEANRQKIANAYRNLVASYEAKAGNPNTYLDELKAAAQDAYNSSMSQLTNSYNNQLSSLKSILNQTKSSLLSNYNNAFKGRKLIII